jgi:hypothetical protein
MMQVHTKRESDLTFALALLTGDTRGAFTHFQGHFQLEYEGSKRRSGSHTPFSLCPLLPHCADSGGGGWRGVIRWI